MRRRALPALAFASASLHVFLVPAFGQTATAAGATDWELHRWLARLQDAPRTLNYAGTLVTGAAGRVSSARLVHVCDGQDRYERVESLDGEPRRLLRHNDRVSIYWPRLGYATVDPNQGASSISNLLNALEQRLAAHYRPQPLGPDRVAGRDADVIELSPRDDMRYGHRVWTDRPTGLLLRAEVRDAQGEVLQFSSFVDVRIGFTPDAGERAALAAPFDGVPVRRAEVTDTTLAAEGLKLDVPVNGFTPMRCVRRTLEPAAAASPEVVQTVYTDGLTHLSLFIERYDPARHGPPQSMTRGATHTRSERRGDRWVTAVGDVPPATLGAFVTALRPLR